MRAHWENFNLNIDNLKDFLYKYQYFPIDN